VLKSKQVISDVDISNMTLLTYITTLIQPPCDSYSHYLLAYLRLWFLRCEWISYGLSWLETPRIPRCVYYLNILNILYLFTLFAVTRCHTLLQMFTVAVYSY